MRELVQAVAIAALWCSAALFGATPAGAGAADRVHVADDSDARAIEIAQSVVKRMGGWDAWDRTRILRWTFFGGRVHHWDRHTGDVRIEGRSGDGEYLWLMNVHSLEGRVWKDGEEITDADELKQALTRGHEVWVNDSYWMVMPYKLLDPGVTLKYGGEGKLEDGRAADILKLTFDEGVGYTPQNGYDVFVARDTGLVEQWAFYSDAADPEPRFTMPWENWQTFGEIMLSNGRGREMDWEIAVHDQLPQSVFKSNAAVSY